MTNQEAEKGKVVFLIVDMQNEFTHEKGKRSETYHLGAKEIVGNIRELASRARQMRIPVIYTRMAFRASYVDAHPGSPSRNVGALLDGTWGTEIIEELQPGPEDIVIVKRRSSAFFGTELESILRALGTRRLVVTGVATNWAVESTVRDAHSHDYEVIVASDGTASLNKEMHEFSLKVMGMIFAKVMTTKEVLATNFGTRG